mmetsp:Transcript_36697/g.80444  ORF Transcript_36697/g.80444 Transcript_36697/m.80444 type:complete len:188 (-) Transcript_36697:211-774(-)
MRGDVQCMSDGIESADVCPKRFGLTYDPPSIILEYLQPSTGKLFHRRIGLKRLPSSTDPARVAKKIRQQNRHLLAEDKVSFDQIVTLVEKLLGGQRERSEGLLNESLHSVEEEEEEGVNYDCMNLNALSTEELELHKARMDVRFFQNQKKPGDDGYVYDLQVDFETNDAQPSGWDSDEDMDASGDTA